MRAAAAHGLTVVPRGSGTKLSWGSPPTSADLVVDLSAMDRVLDHAAGDLIVATEAGARLRTVQETLAGARQRLALDWTVAGGAPGGGPAARTPGPPPLGASARARPLVRVTAGRCRRRLG